MVMENDPYMTTFWLFHFAYEEEICAFRDLCPWLERVGKHYIAELDMLSETMISFLVLRGIPYERIRQLQTDT